MNQVLLLVDLQNDFVKGGALPVKGGEKIINHVNKLITTFKNEKKWIVASKDFHPKNHVSFAVNHFNKKIYDVVNLPYGKQILWPKHCIINSHGSKFIPNLNKKVIDYIVYKGENKNIDSYSAFFENDHKTPTTLNQWLKNKKITDIYLVGLALDVCVFYTALDGIKLNYNVTIDLNGCEGIFLNNSFNNTIKLLKKAGVKIKKR